MKRRDEQAKEVTELPKAESPLIPLEDLLQRGYRYAMSLTHDQTSAEDLVQDAWLAILHAGGPRTFPYLFSSIRSRFVNTRRREQSVPMLPLDEATVPGLVNGHATGTGSVLVGFDRSLERALACLRPVEREVLFLSVVEGYTADEIGRLVGQSCGSVLSLLHRAREKARKCLEEFEPRIK